MNNKLCISVILPVHNEQDNIKKTVEDSLDFLKQQDAFREHEIIAVDDGSTDGTAQILKELTGNIEGLKVVTHSKNLGYGRALVSGVRQARFSWVFMMDADGQFKISSLGDMLKFISDYDIITGYRYKRSDPFYRVFIGKVYTALVCLLFGLRLKDINCGFKLFKREVLDFDRTVCHAGVFYTDIFVKAKAKGYKVKEIPVKHFLRAGGRQTGVGLKVIFEAIKDLFRLGFSRRKRGQNDA